MLSVDSFWPYVNVAINLVLVLTLIKLGLILRKLRAENIDIRKLSWVKRAADAFVLQHKRVMPPEKEMLDENITPVEENANSASPAETKPTDCDKFLGYLHKSKSLGETGIPNECYSCPKLLRCFYSPGVIEKVYGE